MINCYWAFFFGKGIPETKHIFYSAVTSYQTKWPFSIFSTRCVCLITPNRNKKKLGIWVGLFRKVAALFVPILAADQFIYLGVWRCVQSVSATNDLFCKFVYFWEDFFFSHFLFCRTLHIRCVICGA